MYSTHEGLVVKPGYLANQMHGMNDFRDPALPFFTVIEMEYVKHSAEVTPDDWCSLAEEVYRNYYDYDGFVVVHGTDTMHYTATALSFMLVNLAKPVILTGATVPLEEAYNDARRNLINAMMFAAHNDLCEVCIYFNDVLLRGNRAVNSKQTMAAFESPNFPSLAEFRHRGFVVNTSVLLPQPKGSFRMQAVLSDKVMAVTLVPGSDVDALMALLHSDSSGSRALDVLIVELYGIGDVDAASAQSLVSLAARCHSCDTVVGVISPSLVHGMHDWQRDKLASIDQNLIQLDDMTTEAALVKSMFLVGCGYRPDDIRKLLTQNLRGEISVGKHERLRNAIGSKL